MQSKTLKGEWRRVFSQLWQGLCGGWCLAPDLSLLLRLPYNEFFGGVSGLTVEQFWKINGFPNAFWGWGGEDDDLWNRYVSVCVLHPCNGVATELCATCCCRQLCGAQKFHDLKFLSMVLGAASDSQHCIPCCAVLTWAGQSQPGWRWHRSG